ncbi:Carboxypeptidase [Mycena chlorophos]|uniref:Carboxypeptidase n=1 Tax=Mycena chlorophos TaxID=658473 RepID=A0A8H6WP12_MYCCL|nr:Carboxypeptidase [Mycena chlorophos]
MVNFLLFLVIFGALGHTNASENQTFWAGTLGRINNWVDVGAQYVFSGYGSRSVDVIETNFSRIAVPNLCETDVKQYSGYFHISESKHMFFRFFESRSSPSTDPLILWLQGGPGDSGAVGLLLENGPCSIANGGKSTTRNPHSWTNHANVLFVDQPIGVGFSYSSSELEELVHSNAQAATDVYAFLQLFFAQFPEYATLPLHVAGESYGGIYAPHVASAIWKGNRLNATTKIRLESVMLGNGITDPLIQIPSIVDYVCTGPFALYPDPEAAECKALRSSASTCKMLIRACNWYPNESVCGRASRYCRSRLFEPVMKSDLNWYDLRTPCNATALPRPEWCYEKTSWVENYMNDPKVKRALDVDADRKYQNFNMEMNRDFNARGEGVLNAARLLPELVDGGVRLLVYAGNADMMANFIGNQRWVENLDTKFKAEFAISEARDWMLSGTNTVAGRVRSAGGGNLTFVEVYEAGSGTCLHTINLLQFWI